MISEDEEISLYEALSSSADPRLFAPADDGRASIEFPYGGRWRECRIWEGYFEASTILLRTIMQHPLANNLIFPALFNLRHAVEVALKWHIQYAGGVIPKSAGHDLRALIDAFRRTADDLDDEASYISDYALDRISELAFIDAHSVIFRYATERDGSPIEIPSKQWDIFRIYFVAEQLSLWFDGLSDQIVLCQNDEYQAYLREGRQSPWQP